MAGGSGELCLERCNAGGSGGKVSLERNALRKPHSLVLLKGGHVVLELLLTLLLTLAVGTGLEGVFPGLVGAGKAATHGDARRGAAAPLGRAAAANSGGGGF